MPVMFQGDEREFRPSACEFWQMHRVPRSPLYPHTPFLRWLHTDSEENYHRRGNKAFSIESVGYEFNAGGYRGPSFESAQGEVRVLFVGDSNTLGVGTPWEGLWTSLVAGALEDRWRVPVRQINLGWGGTGSDYAAMMIHQTVDVLRPAAVFVLWSFVGRMTWFADARHQVLFMPERTSQTYADDHAAYLRLATDSQTFFNYVRNFHMVNDRLCRLGIPFYWGNLEEFSTELLTSYLPLDGFVGRWEKLDFARDGLHAGLKSHAFFASRVMQAIDRDDVAPASWSNGGSPMNDQPFSPLVAFAEPDTQHVGRIHRPTLKMPTISVWRSIREAVQRGRVARRIRAMKRKDPFIY